MLKVKEDKIFASVLADGAIHIECDEGDEGAKKRDYETSDGKVGTKFEKVYSEISGIINKISFYEGTFGKSLQLEIVDEGQEPITLSLSTNSNYGEDMMKKLPNLNLKERVVLAPYSFIDEKTGKNRKGITVTQNDLKIQNYFYDFASKKITNGYPVAKQAKITKSNPRGTLSKDQWKAYFLEARIFMIDFITEKYELDNEPKKDELDSYGEDIQPEEIEI